MRLWEQAPEIRFIFQRRLQTIYKGLFTICTYLKTKESCDRWVTRRLWGFRHQISKAKYLKISKEKYLKISKDVGRTYREASGEHRSTVQKWLWNSPGKRCRHCAKYGCETLRVSAISRSGYVYPGKLKRPPFPSGIRIPDVKYPNGMSAEKNSGCETSGWNVGGSRIPDVRHPGGMSAVAEFRMWDIRVECRWQQNFGCDTSGWNVGGNRISDVRHPGGMSAATEFWMWYIRVIG